MTALVADASAVIEYLLHGPKADLLRDAWRDRSISVHVPALCDVEVVSVIRRGLRSKPMFEPRAAEAVLAYLDLPIVRHGHGRLLGRMLQLRANFTAYDATYIALAESLGADLITADDALARAARKHTSLVVVK